MAYHCLLTESGCTGFLEVVQGKTKVGFVIWFLVSSFFWGGVVWCGVVVVVGT